MPRDDFEGLALQRLAELEAPGWDEALLEAPLAAVRREAFQRERPGLQAAALVLLAGALVALAWAPAGGLPAVALPPALLRGLGLVVTALLPPLLLAGAAYTLTTLALAGLGARLLPGGRG